ncbi:SULT6B1 [Mytilus edulis]|uniref:SULT6B1 n=1 Tax=Mytilus edulis TaxID=6550 RepID=A0A8S3QZ29_MYTED|nr:SULT6B1 [Mytilus edulis]
MDYPVAPDITLLLLDRPSSEVSPYYKDLYARRFIQRTDSGIAGLKRRHLETEIYLSQNREEWDSSMYPEELFPKKVSKLTEMQTFHPAVNEVIDFKPNSALSAGTHWVHEIITMLVDHTTEYNSRDATLKIHLDFMTDFQLLESETRRRILHSHLPWSFLPSKHKDEKAKVVYVNRNPKDRHASQYNWLKQMNGVPPDFTWKQYYEDMVINDRLLTGWFNYTKEMTKAARNHKNVHCVLFEDLKLRPIETIKQIAEFLEVPFDDQFIAEVADKNVFRKLKDYKQDATVAISRDYKSVLFRKGKYQEITSQCCLEKGKLETGKTGLRSPKMNNLTQCTKKK